MGHAPNNGDPIVFRLLDPTINSHNPLDRRAVQDVPKVANVDNNFQSQPAKSSDRNAKPPKVAGRKRKMDERHPEFALKTTTEKFKFLNNGNPVRFDSEDESAAFTDPINDNDFSDSSDECADYCTSTEYDNAATIKSKPAIIQK